RSPFGPSRRMRRATCRKAAMSAEPVFGINARQSTLLLHCNEGLTARASKCSHVCRNAPPAPTLSGLRTSGILMSQREDDDGQKRDRLFADAGGTALDRGHTGRIPVLRP